MGGPAEGPPAAPGGAANNNGGGVAEPDRTNYNLRGHRSEVRRKKKKSTDAYYATISEFGLIS